MPRQGKREYITFKSTRLPLYPHPNGWRFAFPDENAKGGWRYITRSTKQAAKEAAHAKAIEIATGALDLAILSQDQARLAKAFLDLTPTWNDLEHLKIIKNQNSLTISESVATFHAQKLKEKGKSTNHLDRQHTYLKRLTSFTNNSPLASITHDQIQAWLDQLKLSPKSINDHRSAAVALWRWAEKKEIIRPWGNFNEAQKTSSLELSKKSHIETYTPEEMKTLLQNVSTDFLPWLCITAFSGLRSGELRANKKEPLTWRSIKTAQSIIDCPAHISKNGKRKLIPITSTLKAWLDHIGHMPPDQPIVPRSPNKAETTLLGAKVGGWKRNALRHSYGSYRVAHTRNVSATALEMDNSEKIIKKHYLEAKTKEQGEAYFNLTPSDTFRT